MGSEGLVTVELCCEKVRIRQKRKNEERIIAVIPYNYWCDCTHILLTENIYLYKSTTHSQLLKVKYYKILQTNYAAIRRITFSRNPLI